MSLISNLSTKEKVDLLKELYHDIAGKGQDGDTMLAHINPEEALLLKAHGGSGTINPYTGLPEYKKAIKKIAIVAAVAYGGAALYYGTFSPVSIMNQMKFGALGTGFAGGLAAGAKSMGSLFGEGIISKVGAGLSVKSYLEQRKYMSAQATAYKQQADEAKKQNEMQERIRFRNEKIEKSRILEQQRYEEGQMTAGAASSGLGLTGTSGYLGSTGAIQSTATANLSNLAMASGESTALSQSSQRAADFGTQANLAYGQAQQWSDLGSLGREMIYKSDNIANIFSIG